jgi:hypothetical protein
MNMKINTLADLEHALSGGGDNEYVVVPNATLRFGRELSAKLLEFKGMLRVELGMFPEQGSKMLTESTRQFARELSSDLRKFSGLLREASALRS